MAETNLESPGSWLKQGVIEPSWNVPGSCRLKQALIRDSRYENLYLLPSAQTKDKSAVSPGQMKKLTAELKEEFDRILLLILR